MKFKVEQKFLHTLQGLTNVILLDRDVCLHVPVSAMYIANVPVHAVSPITCSHPPLCSAPNPLFATSLRLSSLSRYDAIILMFP